MKTRAGEAEAVDSQVQGRVAWRHAVRSLLAQPGGAIRMYSPDYADWGLGDPDVIAGLDAWAIGRSQTSVRMLGQRFEGLQRDDPRFVQWRIRFAHVIACHALPEECGGLHECLLLPEIGLLVIPSEKSRLAIYCSGARLHAAVHAFDQAWEHSTPTFSAHTLGL